MRQHKAAPRASRRKTYFPPIEKNIIPLSSVAMSTVIYFPSNSLSPSLAHRSMRCAFLSMCIVLACGSTFGIHFVFVLSVFITMVFSDNKNMNETCFQCLSSNLCSRNTSTPYCGCAGEVVQFSSSSSIIFRKARSLALESRVYLVVAVITTYLKNRASAIRSALKILVRMDFNKTFSIPILVSMDSNGSYVSTQ